MFIYLFIWQVAVVFTFKLRVSVKKMLFHCMIQTEEVTDLYISVSSMMLIDLSW